MSIVRRFIAFWYDFLVGDRLELFVGPIAAMAIVAVAVNLGVDPAVAGFLFFVLIVAVGGFSLVRSLRAASAP